MLFLLKRTWQGSLAALVVLVSLGLGLRWLLRENLLFGSFPSMEVSHRTALLGLAAFFLILCSDGLIHGLLGLVFGTRYWNRYRDLAAVFRNQSVIAMTVGALMAGLGEELLFRGLGTNLYFLAGSGVAFGLLHHLRGSRWPFTFWSIYEGLLFGAALYLTGALFVTMLAHFLHDLAGFLIFSHVNRQSNPR